MHHRAGRLTGAVIMVALLVAGTPVTAQEWFTAEACAVSKVAIDPQVLSPDDQVSLAQRAADIPNGQGRLWQITSPEGRVSHLWGTMHSSERAVLDLPKPVLALIADATVVALETDPVPDTRTAIDEMNQWEGFWVDPDSPYVARDDIDPELLGWITARVVSYGYDGYSIDQMTDAGLASLLLRNPCEDFNGGAVPYQDNYIATLAHLAGVDLAGLEPNSPILHDLGRADMAATARAMVESYGGYLGPWDGPSGRGTYIALYLQGRVAEMMLWSEDDAVETHGAEKAAQISALLHPYLRDGRNHRFVQNAKALLDAGGAFLAVGTFHLPGDQGMVTLLRDAGYRVERVPLPGEIAP